MPSKHTPQNGLTATGRKKRPDFSTWRETGRIGHALERVTWLWRGGRPPDIEELTELRSAIQRDGPQHHAKSYLRKIDAMFLRHRPPRPEDWTVRRVGDRVFLRTIRREYVLSQEQATRIGRELCAPDGVEVTA